MSKHHKHHTPIAPPPPAIDIDQRHRLSKVDAITVERSGRENVKLRFQGERTQFDACIDRHQALDLSDALDKLAAGIYSESKDDNE